MLWGAAKNEARYRVLAAKPLGHEPFDGSPEELRPGIAEQLLRLRVHEHDVAVSVHDHDRIRSGLEKPTELVLRAFAFGHVPHGGRDELALDSIDRRETDFGRKLRLILAQAKEVETGAHGAGVRVREIPGPVLRVSFPVARRHQHLYRLAYELRATVPEETLRLSVDEAHAAVAADDDHGIGRGFEEIGERDLDRLVLAARPRHSGLLVDGGTQTLRSLTRHHSLSRAASRKEERMGYVCSTNSTYAPRSFVSNKMCAALNISALQDFRARSAYRAPNRWFSKQTNSISSWSGMSRWFTRTVHGRVYAFGSSTVISISMRP